MTDGRKSDYGRALPRSAPGMAFAGLILFAVSASAQVGVQEPEGDMWTTGDVEVGGAGGEWLEGSESGDPAGSRTVRLGRGGSLAPRQIPERYVVRKGDTLWDITAHFYGNPYEWPRVWSYNPEITNPHWIYPDYALRLRKKGSGETVEPLPHAGTGDRSSIRVRVAQPGRGAVFLRDQGYLDEEALKAAGRIAGSPEEQMLLSPFDEVYVEFEEGASPEVGSELTVFRHVDREGERLDEEEGELVRILGAVRIDDYDPEKRISRATITEALDPIERGFRVAEMPRRFQMVPPRKNGSDVVTKVVATLRPRQLLADQQVVFVPVGEEQGVRKGNRFFVVRAGDEWRRNISTSPEEMGATDPKAEAPEDYPPEIIAEARVVDVRPQSATLMITRSISEVSIGDRAEMRAGF